MVEHKFELKIRLPQGWKLDEKTLKKYIENVTIIIVDEVKEV
jgi:hypothetical protein